MQVSSREKGQVYNVKRDNSLNTCIWQGSNNWKKTQTNQNFMHKNGGEVEDYAQEPKNKLRA